MGVTVRRTGAPPNLERMVDAAARVVAARAPAIIRARVAAGRDINDKPFARYDAEYAAVVGARVDLSTGRPGGLLETLRTRVARVANGVVVIIEPSAPNARAGAALQVRRPWLGLSPRDLVVLQQDLDRVR